MRILLASLLIFTITSCSVNYKIKRDAKRSPERWFSEDNPPYCDSILDTKAILGYTPKCAYFESDSVRFFISPIRYSGYTSIEDSIYLAGYAEEYEPLFLNGLITGKALETVYGESLYPKSGIMDSSGSPMPAFICGFGGKSVTIIAIEPTATHSRKYRYFKISTIVHDLGAHVVAYYLHIYNDKGDRKMTLAEFCKGTTRSCFRYLYAEV
ncbi:hypothetical protein BH09BAC1_BH09BAC1_19320 [soil metagenome]